jgi:hypothetical protein
MPERLPWADFSEMNAVQDPGSGRIPDPTASYRLERLPDGNIAFSAAVYHGVADQTFILDDDGMILGQTDGYMVAHRNEPLELLVRTSPGPYEQSYHYYDPATGESSMSFPVPLTHPAAFTTERPIPHEPLITDDGGLVLVGYNDRDNRVVRYSREGDLLSDLSHTASGERYRLLGAYGDGSILMLHNAWGTSGWEWHLVVESPDGSREEVYDEPTLLEDTGWRPTGNRFRYPFIDSVERALVDDRDVAYVPFVLAVGGDSLTQSFVLPLERDGTRYTGFETERVRGGECKPHQTLPAGRIVVLCQRRVSNRMYILGM